MPQRLTGLGAVLAAGVAAVGVGCAGPAGPTSFTIDQAEYARAFTAARDELRSHRFDLASVDARMGTIGTDAAGSAGLLTPWIDHSDTLKGAWTDLLNDQRRVAVVRFRPEGEAAAPDVSPADEGADVRAGVGQLRVEVEVQVERLYRPGRRVDATDVRLRSFTKDPAWQRQGLQPWYASAEGTDERLAARMAEGIQRRLLSGE